MIDESSSTRERRDKKLIGFIIPIGILLMLISGQIAARLAPQWMVNAGMGSNLDPDQQPVQRNSPIQPILPAILTPMSWFETFLTPGAGGSAEPLVFMPFVVLEPSATPNETPVPPTVATQPSATAPVSSPEPSKTSSPPPVTGTNKPPGDDTATPPTPTSTAPSPSPSPSPSASPSPSPTATGTPSRPPVGYTLVSPPSDLGVNQPPNGVPGGIGGGWVPYYTVIDLGGRPVVVSGTPDGNYDLVFYEAIVGADPNTYIMLDDIVIGVSDKPDGSYYEVFNWGDIYNVRDQNTNVDYMKLPTDPACAADPECDNRNIPTTSLYGASYKSGILIDVDYNTSGKPPEGSYRYIVILAPSSSDASQIDAIEVVEVAGGKSGMASVQAADASPPAAESPPPLELEEQAQSPDPPADEGTSEPVPDVDEGAGQPPEQAPDPPVEEAPVSP